MHIRVMTVKLTKEKEFCAVLISILETSNIDKNQHKLSHLQFSSSSGSLGFME